MRFYSVVMMLLPTLPLLGSLSDWTWVVDFSIMNLSVFNMSLSFLFEKQNSMFLFTVMLIFVMVYMYSFGYMGSEVYLKRFLLILSMFVASMGVLILSGNLFSSLVGWDGLGVTSMFLILFYYSKSALKASVLTFLMNRVGDCFFILSLVQILLLGESQLAYTISYFSSEILLLMMLTSITKSAQIPFSTWLPAAMEAPTPVSALVHSSTLVTAGIYLLYRYSVLWIDSTFKDLLMILSISTCFMAALSALIENDLKKLIALSTLSQLGFIMFSFSLGLMDQGFMHMLMHAYFKALLFMCAGLVIHSFKGTQSVLNLSISSAQNPVLTTIMSCSLMSMWGMPFLAGFYSKDEIIDSFKLYSSWSVLLLVLLIMSFICTIMYSVRVIWYLTNSTSNWHTMSDSDLELIKPMLPLAILAFLGGGITVWMLMDQNLYVESSKVFVLLILFFAAMSYWYFNTVGSSSFLESKWSLNTFNPLLSNLFFKVSTYYWKSADLVGVPEVINSKIKMSLSLSSQGLYKTMTHYSGSVEFLLFLMVILFL